MGNGGRASSGKRVTTRPVQSIDNNVKLNRVLWILADEMAKFKPNTEKRSTSALVMYSSV